MRRNRRGMKVMPQNKRRPRRSKRLVKHGYDHVGSVVLAFAFASAAFLLFLFVSNMDLQDCVKYGVNC